jgi:putative transposase
MPRRPRLFVPGISVHVIHRGNNRCAMFRGVYDYYLFLDLVLRDAVTHGVAVHGYVLMTNHFHLIATPSLASSLPDMMQDIGRTYVPQFNRRYERTGSLWEGRYRASPIGDEKYWLTCLRYVELNPVRAGLVASPELYEWSSYRAHAFGRQDPLLTPHPLYLAQGQTPAQRQQAWRAMCTVPIEDQALITIRRAVHTNQALQNGLESMRNAGQIPEVPSGV